MFAIPGLKILSLTDAAVARVKELVHSSGGDVKGVRVGVRNGGCAGMTYTLDLVHEIDPADDIVEHDGACVFIQPKAVLFLIGTTMDFVADKLSSQFVFRNPNEISACGCGESVELKPVVLPSVAHS